MTNGPAGASSCSAVSTGAPGWRRAPREARRHVVGFPERRLHRRHRELRPRSRPHERLVPLRSGPSRTTQLPLVKLRQTAVPNRAKRRASRATSDGLFHRETGNRLSAETRCRPVHRQNALRSSGRSGRSRAPTAGPDHLHLASCRPSPTAHKPAVVSRPPQRRLPDSSRAASAPPRAALKMSAPTHIFLLTCSFYRTILWS